MSRPCSAAGLSGRSPVDPRTPSSSWLRLALLGSLWSELMAFV